MNDTFFPGGVWPVMLTPFGQDNKVDYGALEELVGKGNGRTAASVISYLLRVYTGKNGEFWN